MNTGGNYRSGVKTSCSQLTFNFICMSPGDIDSVSAHIYGGLNKPLPSDIRVSKPECKFRILVTNSRAWNLRIYELLVW